MGLFCILNLMQGKILKILRIIKWRLDKQF